MLAGVDGEQFLRVLASEIVTERDVRHWWSRFSSAFQALDLVGAVDLEVAIQIGREIRAALAAATGQEVRDFYLASARRGTKTPARFDRPDPGFDLAHFQSRGAWAPLPSAMGRGAIDFVSQTDDNCWLVSSGPGPAPWPRRESPSPSAAGNGGWHFAAPTATRPRSREEAMFSEVVDDRGQTYQLKMSSSGASSSGAKRERWDLRLYLTPTPKPDVQWLRFTTPHGTVTAALRAASVASVSSFSLPVDMSIAEFHLHRQLHQHVWLHLLDPDRPLARLAVIGDALRATAAVRPDHPLVDAVSSVDDAIAGRDAALPTVVASALRPANDRVPWVGSAALGVKVSHPNGGDLGLEALVGHADRLALHFVQPGWRRETAGASDLVATAIDDGGQGHISSVEPLASPGEGAFHFRPPLAADARWLDISLEGPTAVVIVHVELAGATSADGPPSH
jgi:hypothetical protein